MTSYQPRLPVSRHDDGPRAHVTVDTDIPVHTSAALDAMSVGEVLRTLSDALAWITAHEPHPIDPDSIRTRGRSSITSTLAFTYTRPATAEDLAADDAARAASREHRRAWLLSELADLDNETTP